MLKKHVPGLAKLLKPVAAAYTHVAGYRQMGLKYDDLLMEEREDVQKVSGIWSIGLGHEFGRLSKGYRSQEVENMRTSVQGTGRSIAGVLCKEVAEMDILRKSADPFEASLSSQRDFLRSLRRGNNTEISERYNQWTIADRDTRGGYRDPSRQY
jgi:hypothetical protein